jgi:hypothetical protein
VKDHDSADLFGAQSHIASSPDERSDIQGGVEAWFPKAADYAFSQSALPALSVRASADQNALRPADEECAHDVVAGCDKNITDGDIDPANGFCRVTAHSASNLLQIFIGDDVNSRLLIHGSIPLVVRIALCDLQP